MKRSLHKRSLIKLFAQAHWSDSITRYNEILKLVEAEALLQIHLCFFSNSGSKQHVLPWSAVAVSLHILPKMSEVNSHIWKNALNYRNFKWTCEDSLLCYCYATKRNSGTMLSQVLQRESAGEGWEMSELQAHHCITLKQWSWHLCSVSAKPVNEVFLQELNWSE